MHNKCLLIILLTFNLTVLVSAIKLKEISPEKLGKSYEKINKFLEHNVVSNDPQRNMEKLIEWFHKKSSHFILFGGSSLIESLSLLTRMAQTPSNSTLCNTLEGYFIMELADKGLAYKNHLHSPNYPLSRIDRIIEHYAYKKTKLCRFNSIWPTMKFAFKQNTYDYINDELINRVSTPDIKANMNMAEDLLNSLNFHDGALADALKLLLQLRSVLSEETCDERGLDIIFKNDLATKDQAHKWMSKPVRRIDKMVFHYSYEHAKLCNLILREKFKPLLKQLDKFTFHAVLSLASSYFIERKQYDEMVKSVNEKSVTEDFTNPQMVEFARKAVNFTYDYGRLNDVINLDMGALFDYLRSVTRGDPESKFLGMVPDSETKIRSVHKDKVKDLVDKYLLKPCEIYTTFMGERIILLDEYHSRVDKYYLFSAKEKFLDELYYHIARAGFQACKFVKYRIGFIYRDMALIARIW